MRKIGKLFTYYNQYEDSIPSWTRISRIVYAFLLWNYIIIEVMEDLVDELLEFKFMYKQSLLITAILFTIGAI